MYFFHPNEKIGIPSYVPMSGKMAFLIFLIFRVIHSKARRGYFSSKF